ncbi:acyl-CoA dehydrogenase family protein, partial [Mycobacterium tuberculosis]
MNQSETEIEILAEKIARWARARSAEIERDRRLPDELVTRLREAGLLRATMPREVAAPELAPGRALRCAEAVARGDASAGWCVSIAITSALLVAYLPARSRANRQREKSKHRKAIQRPVHDWSVKHREH